MRDSLETLWRNKSLWLFGIFLAGSGSGGGGDTGAGGSTGSPDIEGMPGWVIGLIVGAVIVGIAGVIMHLISEGALIEGVARSRQGDELTVRGGFRAGWSHLGVVFRLKGIALTVALLSAGVLGTPAILHELGLISTLAAGLLTVPAVIIGVPWLLSLWIIYNFALRIAVLENRHAIDAIRRGRLFFHRRLLAGLQLILANAIGQAGMGILLVLCAIPAAPFAGVGFLAGDWLGAAIAGGAVFLPLVVAVMGALGTFQSSVWTLGFLAEREA